MTIYKNLQKVHVAVMLDTLNNPTPTLGMQVMLLAQAAIEGGIASDAWKDYMSLFADNAQQLARLRGLDGSNAKDYQRQFRAYIAANAMCDASTDTKTGARVDTRIDELITDDQPDGTIDRPQTTPPIPFGDL